MRNGALEGIRVLDLGRVIAAPLCTMVLGDLGAEVIKVERAVYGDDLRTAPPFKDGVNVYYPAFNRNKKEVSIDFRNPKGLEVLRRLIENSDVMVSNFRPGTMEAMGFSWEEVQKINPRMIMACISGFGQSGPYRDKAAFDYIAQAKSGFMSMTGDAKSGPMRAGLPVSDHMGGIYAAVGILAALYNRTVTGKGQYIDVALYDALITTLGPHVANYGCNGIVDKGWGNRDIAVPVNVYKVKDGSVYIHSGSNPLYKRFAKLIGNPALMDPKFDSMVTRKENEDFIDEIVQNYLKDFTCAEAEATLDAAGIPCGAVASVDALFSCEQVKAREMLLPTQVEGVGEVLYPGMPIKLSDTPCKLNVEHFTVGSDNDAVLTELLGYSEGEVAQLKAEKAI